MKALTISEKVTLVQMHGAAIAGAFKFGATHREDILEAAQRVIEIAKSIPKTEYAIPRDI